MTTPRNNPMTLVILLVSLSLSLAAAPENPKDPNPPQNRLQQSIAWGKKHRYRIGKTLVFIGTCLVARYAWRQATSRKPPVVPTSPTRPQATTPRQGLPSTPTSDPEMPPLEIENISCNTTGVTTGMPPIYAQLLAISPSRFSTPLITKRADAVSSSLNSDFNLLCAY